MKWDAQCGLPDFLEVRDVVFLDFWRLQTMLFGHSSGSGPSRVPILRIFGIYVISGTFPRRTNALRFESWGARCTRFWGLDFERFCKASLFLTFLCFWWPEVPRSGVF